MTQVRRYGNRSILWTIAAFAAVLSMALPTVGSVAQEAYDPALYQALEWRNVGPFRGGRVTAVEGVASQPLTFYFGATGGGVWKTVNGGLDWKNVSDGAFGTGSVGAIAVAPSDANVVYAGMGEHGTRGVTTSHGDGVYKSTDGGKTWSHMGLAATRHISQIRVHPENPDLVYVGAQGSPWGPNPERGIYRSTNGGKTWSLVLHVNSRTGANDLSMDPNNPRVLYAAMWEHQRKPWHGYQMTSGGPGSGLHKTTDGGETWTRLAGGLPAPAGKFAVSVSAANSDRVYALVEAHEGGVYRSDNGGKNWKRVNSLHVMTERSAYYMHIFADTQDENAVYVLNAPMYKSTDGGVHYQRVPTPHGDNHDLWIHPEHNDWMVQGNDGGANVSYDGGKSWSTQGNQPTAQFYRVNVDNLYPYNIYGGQQDNSTIAIASRSFGGGIGPKEWHPVGGGESAHVAFDADNPVLIYAGSYQGNISEYDSRTDRARNIMHYPMRSAFRQGNDYPYRFNWNAPIVVSQHDSKVIYHAAHVLLKSEDRGQSWTEISPDLTRNDASKQGVVEGEFTFEGTGGEMYNTIFYVAESPHAAGEIWVGSDDGLVHLTRDGGKTWAAVTPRGLGETQINAIEVSPHAPGTAYLAATAYKFNDFQPNIYITTDYGKSWRRRVAGIADGDFVRVVREDPVRKDLLYAGAETGIYVSFNGGRAWQSLQLNLPVVPVTDIKVHGNDLVVSTQGRAFWVLDDLSPLRQLDASAARAGLHLFEPAAAPRVQTSRRRGGGRGQNPPEGSVIYYTLGSAPGADEPLKLEILDSGGAVVNTYSSEQTKARKERLVAWFSNDAKKKALPARPGQNRFVWNWQRAAIADYKPLENYRGARGYRVAPGTYTARLSLGDDVRTQEFEVLADPRASSTPQDYAAQQVLLADIFATAEAVQQAVAGMAAVRDKANGMVAAGSGDVAAAGRALATAADDWVDRITQFRDKRRTDALHSPRRIDFNFLSILRFADALDPPVTEGVKKRFADLKAEWAERQAEMTAILETQLPAFNAALGEGSPLAIPAPGD